MTADDGTLLDLVRASDGSIVMDGARLTAADLALQARATAVALAARGVGPGDAVVLVDDGSGAELLRCLLAAWSVGARAALVSGTADEAEVAAVVRQTGASLLVRRSPRASDGANEVAFRDLSAQHASAVPPGGCAPDDIALDVASSGTTSAPKCVSYTHRALRANVEAIGRRLHLTPDDVLYSPLPLSVAGVLCMVVLPGLRAGATIHVGRLASARVAAAHGHIQLARPTLLYAVPYVYDLLSRKRGASVYDRLRWAVCSSSPLPAPTFDRLWKHLGVPLRNAYCLAEAATVTLNTCTDPDEIRETVGTPLDGVEVAVEQDAESGAGPEGRLIIRGTSCGLGYRQDGRLVPFSGGEVRTSDLGLLRNGLLTVTGRSDRVIQVAGRNVDLSLIRRAVAACPGLGDFEVVADQHPRLGAVPVLLAEARTLTVPAARVMAFCRTVLHPADMPREIRVLDELPRTITGKVRTAAGGVNAAAGTTPKPHHDGRGDGR
ncbi:class I adenylate-forming enzyme family protein [Streptomyces sp. 900105755]